MATLMEAFFPDAVRINGTLRFPQELRRLAMVRWPLAGVEGAGPRINFNSVAARQTLTNFIFTMDVGGARAYLDAISGCGTFLKLYQHYFPKEWAESTSSILPIAAEINHAAMAVHANNAAARGQLTLGFSQREIEFLNLVHENLFPISLDYISQMADEGERTDLIIFEYQGLNWAGVDDVYAELEVCRVAWKLLYILNFGESYDGEEYIEELKGFILRDLKDMGRGKDANEYFEWLACAEKEQVDGDRLKEFCDKEKSPLRHLLLAVQVMDSGTGNLFVDCSDMMPCEEFYWSQGQETIDRLAREYNEAQDLLNQVGELVEWIEADPKNFGRLIKVWNKSQKHQTRARVTAV